MNKMLEIMVIRVIISVKVVVLGAKKRHQEAINSNLD
jgi:hypothetical protein